MPSIDLHIGVNQFVSCAQRIREQIRTWANDATIRDTSLLIEARRAIEHQMVLVFPHHHLCPPLVHQTHILEAHRITKASCQNLLKVGAGSMSQ